MRRVLKTIAGALLYYSGLFRLFIHLNRKKVIVLAYHSVTDDSRDVPGMALPQWVLDRRTFHRQMRFVKEHFTNIRCGEAVAYLSSAGRDDPAFDRPMILSFDDGFENHITNVAPVLDHLGLKGVFFVVGRQVAEGMPPIPHEVCELLDTRSAAELESVLGAERKIGAWSPSSSDEIRQSFYRAFLQKDYDGQRQALMELREKLPPRVTRYRYATNEDLRELVGRGHEVGSHSYDHVKMALLNDEQLASDVARSRAAIEKVIHDRVHSFCYPYGVEGTFDGRAESAIEACGFTCAFTSVEGMNVPTTDLFALKRIPITEDSGFFTFVLKVTGVEMALKKMATGSRGHD